MGQTLVIDLGDSLATVSFSSEDVELTMENVGQLRDALRAFMGGEEAPPRRTRTRRSKPQPDESANARPLRTWAKNNGYDIGDYGRIPEEVREAYQRSLRPTPLSVAPTNGLAHNDK